ncbi:MAG: GNAT family N-acetyltransferase [Jiangellaceae bacterium]
MRGGSTIEAVPLRNEWVALEPLAPSHAPELAAAVGNPAELFRWMSIWMPATDLSGMVGVVAAFVEAARRGELAPWAIRRRRDGALVGSTSYLDIDVANRHVEVGATWIGEAWWRTEVNTATKLLVLGHAFDTLGMERVALKTHHLNVRSHVAIERLGAVREGVLRHHMLHPDGRWRDTVYYSILRDEWPAARNRLLDRLG